MAPPKEKLRKNAQEDYKRMLLRARKLPWASYFTGTTVVAFGIAGYAILAGGVIGIVGAVIGGLAGGLLKGAFQALEKQISVWLYDVASRIEIVEQTDTKDKNSVPNTLLDEFDLFYHGGHPLWKPEKPEFGNMFVFERAVIFKNLRNRYRLPIIRVGRCTLETLLQVRLRKLPDVYLRDVKLSKNKALNKIREFIRKKQRFVVLEYTDDTGQLRIIVFWPHHGNPQYAKHIKETLEGAVKKAAKDRAARSEGALNVEATKTPTQVVAIPRSKGISPLGSPPGRPGTGALGSPSGVNSSSTSGLTAAASSGDGRGGLHKVSQETIEAAQRASASHSDPSDITLTKILGGVSHAKLCPYCKFSLKESIVSCSACHTEHHEGCWKANFGCTTSNCRGKPVKKNEGAPTANSADPSSGASAAHTEDPGRLPGPVVGVAATATVPNLTGVAVLFQVVLTHAGHTDEERDQIARAMAKLFNIPVDKVRIVLQRVPAVARRNLGRDEADALAESFRTMGAQANVEEMPQSG